MVHELFGFVSCGIFVRVVLERVGREGLVGVIGWVEMRRVEVERWGVLVRSEPG